MRIKCFITILIAMITVLIFSSCNLKLNINSNQSFSKYESYNDESTSNHQLSQDASQNNKTDYYIDMLPDIMSFSNFAISGEKSTELFGEYASFKSVVLHNGNTEIPLNVDDPNLIRLYNFIGYSFDQGTCYARGMVDKRGYTQMLYWQGPYLEITTNEDTKNYTKYFINKNIIFLVFEKGDQVYSDVPNTYFAYPYIDILENDTNKIDMLKLCGIIDE